MIKYDDELSLSLRDMAIAFGVEIPAARIRIYKSHLKDIEDNIVIRSIKKLTAGWSGYGIPTIFDIRKESFKIEHDMPRAPMAWEMLAETASRVGLKTFDDRVKVIQNEYVKEYICYLGPRVIKSMINGDAFNERKRFEIEYHEWCKRKMSNYTGRIAYE